MINGLEGIPGSGKSYEAVVFHVLATLKTGRKVITNLPLNIEVFAAIDPAFVPLIEVRTRPRPVLGSWDANRVDEKGNGNAFELWPDGAQPSSDPDRIKARSADGQSFYVRGAVDISEVTTFGHVWDFYDPWRHEDGRGALFVIDECHNAFPKIGTDKQVVQWFKLHRHFNADVLLMTQNFRDMDQPISGLIAMLIKVRKADILGKKDSYIRKVHAGYRGAVISTEERKYQPQFFSLYKSHTQGNSVAESAAGDVQPLLVKFNKFSRIFYVITVIACIYAGWRIANPPAKTRPLASIVSTPSPVSAAVTAAASPGEVIRSVAAPSSGAVRAMQEMPDDAIPEPYASKNIHLTGRMTLRGKTLYTFAVADGSRRVGQITSDELVAMGYRWDPLGDCAGTLRWNGSAKAVICDAPFTPEASSSNPVVIALPAGSVTPTARSDGLAVAVR